MINKLNFKIQFNFVKCIYIILLTVYGCNVVHQDVRKREKNICQNIVCRNISCDHKLSIYTAGDITVPSDYINCHIHHNHR